MSDLIMNISTFLLISAVAAWTSLLLKRRYRWLAVGGLVLLSILIPVAGTSIWLWVNGAAGELSILTLILLAGFILRILSGFNLLTSATRTQLYFLIFLLGLLLYPATLGMTMYDPYSAGYSSVLSLLLIIVSVVYWVFQQRQLAIILLLVAAADETGFLSSHNTWDALMDPLLWLFSPVLLAIVLFASKRKAVA